MTAGPLPFRSLQGLKRQRPFLYPGKGDLSGC